jgi:crotonobetainyl-CoA:carnitine CoA-transferase CaiB-like acyl-CoA transferase
VRGRTQADCIAQLVKAEVAVAPVSDFKDLAEDPHLVAREVLTTLDDPELGTLRMPRVLPQLSDTPGRIAFAGLPMGSHNAEIYGERLGLSAQEIAALKSDGVI